jgi:hypothetical protein
MSPTQYLKLAIRGYSPNSTQNSTCGKNSDPIEDLTPIQSKRSYEIMQITNEKPKIDDVIEAHIRANGHEIEQKDRYTDEYETYSCFNKHKAANFETHKPALTETGLQIVTGWIAEPCFCPSGRADWN